MKFFLGTHQPAWLGQVNIPWFVSVMRLLDRKGRIYPLGLPVTWCMDSGGFSQILQHGRYTVSEAQYLDVIEQFSPPIAFCQDWMCEEVMLEKTGLTVREHQERTTASYLSMSYHSGVVRPVLQGWTPADYVAHAHAYKAAGCDMGQLFGLGTVCSRNGSADAILFILTALNDAFPGIRLHGFGLKTTALHNIAVTSRLESADSMAWSSRGRRMKLCPWPCMRNSCANCMEYALLWRRHVVDGMNQHSRKGIFEVLPRRMPADLPLMQMMEARG